jgi:hypothetical protein
MFDDTDFDCATDNNVLSLEASRGDHCALMKITVEAAQVLSKLPFESYRARHLSGQ